MTESSLLTQRRGERRGKAKELPHRGTKTQREKMSEKLKVYRMNDYDWWADYSEDEARKNYTDWQIETCGIDKEDVDTDCMYELSEEQMLKAAFIDEDASETVTFKDYLDANKRKGFFASTEC